MKRALIAFAMLVVLLLPAQALVAPRLAFAADPGYSIDQLTTDIYVETDSSMHVVERQVLTFGQQNKGLVWHLQEFEQSEPVKIASVRAVQLDSEGAAVGDWLSLQHADCKPEEQGLKPGDVPDASWRGADVQPWYSYSISDNMVRCYFPADAGTYMLEVDYTAMRRVTVFRDVGELYWRYAQSDMPVDAHDVSLRVALPVPAGFEIQPDTTVMAWGHGPVDGTFSVGEDGSVTYHVDVVKAGHYAEAHMLFPSNWIDNIDIQAPNHQTEMRRSDAIAEESQWLDQSARASIWDNKVRVVFMPLVAIAALVAIVIAIAFGRSSRTRRWFVRIAATLGVIALAEQAFFREPLTTCVLLIAAAAIALLAGCLPLNDEVPEEELCELCEPDSESESDNPTEQGDDRESE